jgi:hypothetical protein
MYTINLNVNQIGDQGAIELAKALTATRVHTLNLKHNRIGNAMQQLLMEQYPSIKWGFY